MKLLKPKFWHKKNSFFSIVLLPLTFLVLVYLFFKKKIISTKEFKIPIICMETFTSVVQVKHHFQ